MAFRIESVQLNEIVVLLPEVRGDARGFFMEAFRSDQFGELGLPTNFVQDNHSKSKKGVLRGLHFQWDLPMGKLMRVINGAAFLVAVDIRRGSPTLGKWFGLEVSAENKKQVWAPYGFARCFARLLMTAKCFIRPRACITRRAKAGFILPIRRSASSGRSTRRRAEISARDRNAPRLAQWLESPLSAHVAYRGRVTGAIVAASSILFLQQSCAGCFQLLPPRLIDLGELQVKLFQRINNHGTGSDVGKPFVVGGDDIPGRVSR